MATPPSPHRVLPARSDVPLHDAAATRLLESAAGSALREQALDEHALMQRAGLSVARLARALAPGAHRIAVVCGPGNNGGDGLVAAAHLIQQGCAVQVQLVGEPDRLPTDARRALEWAQSQGISVCTDAPSPGDMAIDALLGLGLGRVPQGAMAESIAWLNQCTCPVLAVDLPSGLSGDTGAIVGEQAVRARWTLSLLSLKPGLFTAQGRDHAGEIWFDALGTPAGAPPAAHLLGASTAQRTPPHRRHTQHKGSFGDVVVVGGAAGMQGAAWLAGRAACGAGAGRVLLSLLDPQAPVFDGVSPELMSHPKAWEASPAWLQARTVVCGCGGGNAVRDVLPALIHHAGRLVLDADALNVVAADPASLASLRGRRQRGRCTILTPHPLEAARLIGCDTAGLQADRLGSARRLAESTGAVVVLKGSGTVIATPDGELMINATGNARLATAGTGDVLAGWIGGVWSQLADDDLAAARDACAAAVWLHGAAAEADLAASPSLRASDLIDAMRRLQAR